MSRQDAIVIDDDEGTEATESQIINEEYKIWKKNTPFLYDTVITHALTWPSLTCQWLPDQESPKDADYTVQRMILGTHTSSQASDQLLIAEVLLPKAKDEDVAELYDEEKQELGSHTKSSARVRVKQTINHDGEVNRARYMPQNPDLIATKTVRGEVFVFDRTKHETTAPKNGECKPDIRLKGQTKEGYGLSWSKLKTGQLLSASEDTTVAHWDIEAYSKKDATLHPVRKYTGHASNVGDVDWHSSDVNLFGSVGDDRMLMIWDTRSDNTSKASMQVEAHTAEINCIGFAPSSDYLVLTGSSDKTVALWDTRKLDLKLHTFDGHTDEVLQIAWSPHSPVHFASAGADRRVNIWNLDAIGAEQTPDDAEDGPPELLFVHGGHTAKVSDLSWSPSAKWHLASTAEDNILQVWEPSRHIRAAGDADVNAMELE
ncbi:histone acetyltransferase type B subunit 2 [Kockovaella imperatae]|uniref:Histone acetyltransferase type B subunit 2 n=1 Tax=Kockovaella imperatae TaxID=4999 RepID=A0A1Y1UI89_9TREE|nr:histone acetyltransferase type B subunit 2 [Kockovaella imperatae]ORX37768.1 histone acetyltransferase type B subunit 2 [Kockovaella imperatae]